MWQQWLDTANKLTDERVRHFSEAPFQAQQMPFRLAAPCVATTDSHMWPTHHKNQKCLDQPAITNQQNGSSFTGPTTLYKNPHKDLYCSV